MENIEILKQKFIPIFSHIIDSCFDEEYKWSIARGLWMPAKVRERQTRQEFFENPETKQQETMEVVEFIEVENPAPKCEYIAEKYIEVLVSLTIEAIKKDFSENKVATKIEEAISKIDYSVLNNNK